MLPKADFPDPLIQERRRRTRAYVAATFRKPYVLAALIGSAALVVVHPALVPAAWAVIAATTAYFAHARASREWWSMLAVNLHMTVGGDEDLIAATPLLRSGDEREVLRSLVDSSGRRLAQFRSTDVRTDSDGTERTHHDYTVVFTVDAAPTIRFLSAHEHTVAAIKWLGDDRRGRLPGNVDEFRCESVEVHDRYELRSSEEDASRAREIFSPTFMVWFARNGIEFEYENGALTVLVDRVLDHAEEHRVLLHRADLIRQQIAGLRPDLGALTQH